MEDILEDLFPVLDELLVIGGEPLITPDCLNLISRMDAQKYPDLRLALITNGTVVSSDVMDLLFARRISWILVSIDAATPETYSKVRGGELSKVIEGVKKLNEIRHRHNDSWALTIGFVFMRSNMHEAIEFVKLADNLDVRFCFQPVFGTWHDESYYHQPDQVKRASQILGELDSWLEVTGRGGDRKTDRLHARLELAKSDVRKDDSVLLETERPKSSKSTFTTNSSENLESFKPL
jgi:MoaA/NifB/PqqE/SkfB family radical SAM enzyme